jgi:hypothetical protein
VVGAKAKKLIAWFRKRRATKERVNREADRLLKVHGAMGAWQFMFRQSRDMTMQPEFREFALKVRREIEHRTRIKTQVDTATRYLE